MNVCGCDHWKIFKHDSVYCLLLTSEKSVTDKFSLFISDLHTLWKMLHLQLGAGRAATAGHYEGRDGEWPGADAGHPAGRVPARVGRDRYDSLNPVISCVFSVLDEIPS